MIINPSNIFKQLLLTVLISIALIARVDAIQDSATIKHISFSPDGNKLIFDRCQQGQCAIHVYDLKTGDLGYYQSPNGEYWSLPRYSYDGTHIVFSRTPKDANGKRLLEDMQIAVMKVDGSEIKTITQSKGAKIYPAFSHAGDKVIYAQAANLRKPNDKTPAADYDFFESSVTANWTKQLTHYEFFMVSPTFYMPDDKRFVFSVYGPRRYSLTEAMLVSSREREKRLQAYEQKYGRNLLFVLSPDDTELLPYLTHRTELTESPVLDASNRLYFTDSRSMLNQLDKTGLSLGQWRSFATGWADGTSGNLASYDVAPNAKQVICVWAKEEWRRRIYEVSLRNLDGSDVRQLTFPTQAHRINNVSKQLHSQSLANGNLIADLGTYRQHGWTR